MYKITKKDTRTTSMTSFYVFIVNFKYVSNLFPVFLVLTLNMYLLPSGKHKVEQIFFGS